MPDRSAGGPVREHGEEAASKFIALTREEVGLCIDAVAMLMRRNDVDNPYPALLRRLQDFYRVGRGLSREDARRTGL